MERISCVVCGRDFPKRHRSRSRVCSDECRRKREQGMRKASDARRTAGASCVDCGRALDSHSARGRCASCYTEYRRANPDRYGCSFGGCAEPRVSGGLCSTHRSRQAKGLPLGLQEIACPTCETPFVPTRDYAIYCGSKCAGRAGARRRLGIAARPVKRACWWCDEPFQSDDFRRICCPGDCVRIAKSLWDVRDKYGISRDDYKRMWRQQGGKCACCDEPQTGRYRRLAVDHDHACCPGEQSCGQCVRGLLCSGCNNMLGCARDSAKRLRAGAEYLERIRQTALRIA